MIRFSHVTKIYDDKPVLQIDNFNLERSIYWLTGINGSGKTTLMRMMAGMIPFQGDIQLEDIQLRQQPISYRRLVNFAEAEPMYPGFISGIELVKFYQEVRNADATQTDMLIYLFKMKDFISHSISRYSSGMVKKLSLLLAFIGKPSLMLLDEPLATLDETAIQILPELMNAYYKEFKTCIIFSSHQHFNMQVLTKPNKILISDQKLQLIA